MSKRLDAAREKFTDALTELTEAIALEAAKAGDLAEAMPTTKKKPTSTDEDDDAADVDPAARAKALKKLAALDLSEMSRPEMKPFAEALGIDTQGKKSDELRKALEAAMADGGKSKAADDDDEDEAPVAKKRGRPAKSAPADEDDDEEPAPAKKKGKTVAADEDDDEDEPAPAKKKKPAPAADEDDDDEVDVKTMRKELKIFCAAPDNKKAILKRDPKFFNGKDAPDGADPRLHQILADEDLLRESWTDNVKDLHAGGGKAWSKVVKAAEAAAADDDE